MIHSGSQLLFSDILDWNVDWPFDHGFYRSWYMRWSILTPWSIHLLHVHYSYRNMVRSSRCLRASSTSGDNFLTLISSSALKPIYSFVATKTNLLLALYFAVNCPFFSLIRCFLIFRPSNLFHFNRWFSEFLCPSSFYGYHYSSYIRILSLILMGTVHFRRVFLLSYNIVYFWPVLGGSTVILYWIRHFSLQRIFRLFVLCFIFCFLELVGWFRRSNCLLIGMLLARVVGKWLG